MWILQEIKQFDGNRFASNNFHSTGLSILFIVLIVPQTLYCKGSLVAAISVASFITSIGTLQCTEPRKENRKKSLPPKTFFQHSAPETNNIWGGLRDSAI